MLHGVTAAAHGPPGVGKSLTHWLAARALYNADPLADSRCPGHACAGYKVDMLLCCKWMLCCSSAQLADSAGRHSTCLCTATAPLQQVMRGRRTSSSAGAVWHGLRQRRARRAACVPAGRAAGSPEAGVARAIPPIDIAAVLK